MNQHRANTRPTTVFFCLSLLAALALPAAAQNKPADTPLPVVTETRKAASVGTFTDKAGIKHVWQINNAHALLWDNSPYLPTGVTFAPRSFAADTDAAWQEDTAALTALKSHGIHDLLVAPPVALPTVPKERVQRLLEYLEANEFAYGMAFGDGIIAPLIGTVVKPTVYRYDSREGSTAQWTIPNADSGLFILVDVSDKENKIVRGGTVRITDPEVAVPIEAPASAGRVVALLYPHKTLVSADKNVLPDLWNGFDGCRDRLLARLAELKFGAHFRFFLDPLGRPIGLGGETDYCVPDSEAFRLEYEAYLTRHYISLDECRQSWGLAESTFKTYAEISRLIPLWANERGAPYFYDPATGKTHRIADTRQSRWWSDFLAYRNESVTYYMNALANVLKRQVADVPVAYTWTQTHPIFVNADRDGGFDALAVTTDTKETGQISRTLGPAYSAAEQAGRTTWCLAGSVKSADASRLALFNSLDELRRVGYKAFYATPGTSKSKPDTPPTVAANPEPLTWLVEYGNHVASESNAARYAPQVLFYPQQSPGPARTGFIGGTSGNVLWLGAFSQGDPIDMWPAYRGYSVKRSENLTETTLVSLQGTRRTQFNVVSPRGIRVRYADGTLQPIHLVNRYTFEITLDDKPTIIETNGQRLFPREAAEDIVTQLVGLYAQAVTQKVPAVESEKPAMDRARYAYKNKDYETAYTFARSALDELTYLAAPYIWIEGELPYRDVNTFTEVASHVEASGGQYLRLNTPNAPGRFGYAARYLFDVPADGTYNLWLAGSAPGTTTSPIKWRVNTEPEQDPIESKPRGTLYLSDRFGWTLLGSAQLKRGPQQSLTIYVVDRAAETQEYNFAIDALLLTTKPFTPNGTVRPLPIDGSVLRAVKRSKKGDDE